MNVSKVSFGQTFKLARPQDAVKAEKLIQKMNESAKLLTNESLPIDIAQNVTGDYFLLTNEESHRYREIQAERYVYNEDELKLSMAQRENVVRLTKQTKVDNLIDKTYNGEHVAVKRGVFVYV